MPIPLPSSIWMGLRDELFRRESIGVEGDGVTRWTTTTNNTVWAPYTSTTGTAPNLGQVMGPSSETELRWAYERMQAELERLEVGKKWMVLPAAPKRKLEMLPFWEEE